MGKPSRTLTIVFNVLIFFAPVGSFSGPWSSLVGKLIMMLITVLAPTITILYLHMQVSRRKITGAIRPILIAVNAVILFFFLATMIAGAVTEKYPEPPGVFYMLGYMMVPITNILAVAILKRREGNNT